MAAWAIWLIAAGLLAIAEMLSLSFVLVMLAGGAGIAAVLASVGLPVPLQGLVFAIVSVGLLVLVRPIAQKHLLSSTHAGKSPMDHLIGSNAIVTSTVDARQGRVKIGGNEWSAAAYDPAQILEAGQTVQVMEIRGATAVVWGEP